MTGNIYKHKLEDVLWLVDANSVENTARAIARDAAKKAAPFNYNPARAVCRAAMSGEITLEGLKKSCVAWSEQGTLSNTEAATLLWENSSELSDVPLICHELKETQLYEIRHDLRFPVKIPFFFVQDGKVILPWIQYRKTFQYTRNHWGLLSTLVNELYSDVFYPDPCEVVFIDLAAPHKSDQREFKIYRAHELPVFDKKYLTDFFGVYAAAYDQCRSEGIQKSKRKPKEKRDSALILDLFADSKRG